MNPYKNLPLVRIPQGIFHQIRKGSQWVYRDSLPDFDQIQALLPEGGWVNISSSNKPSGLALFDPQNAIALRVIDSTPQETPLKPVLKRKIIEAVKLRNSIDRNQTNGFRLIHGEGDLLPGLTIDYYNGLLVTRPDSFAWIAHLPLVLEFLEPQIDFHSAYLLYEDQKQWLKGECALPHFFKENDLNFITDPSAGQKTGFFLDMRPNRHAIKRFAREKAILNCYSYTGAFSVYARSGGASSTVNIDISRGAIEAARENHQINGFNDDKTTYEVGDVLKFLEHLPEISPWKILSEKCPYDVIILDPPAFAHSKEKIESAKEAYYKLNLAALKCLGSGQYLATASCSSRISPADFSQILSEAASDNGKKLKQIYSHGADEDHPVAVNSGISPYLKFQIYIVE